MFELLIPKADEMPIERGFRRALTALAVIVIIAASSPVLAVSLAVKTATCGVPAGPLGPNVDRSKHLDSRARRAVELSSRWRPLKVSGRACRFAGAPQTRGME